jgi:2-polyprenyl-6-methoxyphenol hydroxylase-like FAD-dependent oxidoreductase
MSTTAIARTSTGTRSAIVLGAGIGGLTAAVALRRAGVDVTLCERAPELRAAGFGLSVQSNAMTALRTLGMGLDEELLRVGGRVTTFSFRAPDGALLRRLEMADTDAGLGAPSVVLARNDLHSVLLHAAGSDLHVEAGVEAVGFEGCEDGVRLRLADGRHLRADVLIGADGINSTVRAQLHGAAAPRSGGFVCWLALAPFRHPAFAQGESAHFWGRGMRFGVHDIGHDNTYWWATMSTDPDLATHWPYGKDDLLRRFRSWAPEIGEIVAATTESDILALPAQDRPPLSRWGRGRVTLLGDAAHPMLPSLGQGANSAIEDAVVLAHAVATHGDPETALRTYERRRLRRTTALVDGSRALGRIEQSTNLAVTTARNRIVRYASEKQLLATMIKPMIWPGFGDEPRFGPTPRPLSSLERWHWTADQAAPLHIASSVRISGRVDADTIRAALDALVHRHPILRTAIRSDGGTNPRFVPAQLRPIPLRLVDGGSWLTEIDGELRDRFQPDAPLLRATLIAVEPGVHDFMLTSTYSIADSVSVVSLARQVLEMAAGGAPDWSPELAAPAGPEHLVPETFQGLRGKGQGLTRLAADAISARRISPVRLSPEAQLPPDERFTRLAHRTIGGSEYRALLSECRRRHIRCEAAIAAALAAAAGADAGAGDADFTIGVSVPFRDHLAQPLDTDTVGSFQAMLAIPGACRPGQPLWEAAQSFDAGLRNGIRRRHHLAALGTLGLLTPKTPAKADGVVKLLDARGPGNMCMSLLDVSGFPDRIGDWRLSAVQFASGMSISGYLMLTAAVGQAELALNLGYIEDIISSRRAETLIENTTAALRKAVSEVTATSEER